MGDVRDGQRLAEESSAATRGHGHAVHFAFMHWVVVAAGEMLGGPVVPDDDGVWSPTKTHLEARVAGEREQLCKNGCTLVVIHPDNEFAEAFVDEQHLCAADRMPDDHRVLGDSVGLLGAEPILPIGLSEICQESECMRQCVARAAALDLLSKRRRQGSARSAHVDPERVATDWRDTDTAQDRSKWRIGLAGQIAVPELGLWWIRGIVADDVDLRRTLHCGVQRMRNPQFTEGRSERKMHLRGNHLISEDQDATLDEGVMDLVAQRIDFGRKVDLGDLRAERGGNRFQPHVATPVFYVENVRVALAVVGLFIRRGGRLGCRRQSFRR